MTHIVADADRMAREMIAELDAQMKRASDEVLARHATETAELQLLEQERTHTKMPAMPARLASYGAPDRRKRFLGSAMWQYLGIRVMKDAS